VGRAVRSAIEAGAPPSTASLVAALAIEGELPSIDAALLEPEAIVRRSEHGGGPGPQSLDRTWRWARERWREHLAQLIARRLKRRAAAAELAQAVCEVTGAPVAAGDVLPTP
jgi:hypothetical protein